MTGFAAQHDYRLGRALLLATALVLLGSWLFPVDWLRVFGRRLEAVSTPETGSEPWVRLIPVESFDPPGDLVPIQITTESVNSPELDDMSDTARVEWSFDPTSPWRPLDGSAEPRAPALPDSILLRGDLLNALRLANWSAVFAMLDTTQAGRAREQFLETDAWVNQVLGPVWTAQGFARRQAALWYRVVGEVEKEGSQ